MAWFGRKQREEELERELRDHLELEAAEQQQRGLDLKERRSAAQRAFGNTTLVKELVRESWGWGWLERSKADLTYAFRSFARTPAFTAVVILTLGLGIGATTAIFSIVNTLLLHPLPYPNAERLVVVWEKLTRDPKAPPVFDSYLDFQDWKDKNQSFEDLAPATWATGQQILRGGGRARNVLAMPVGLDFFSLLAMKPALGRTFLPDDLHAGCTVVLKHSFWATALASRRDAVGRHVSLGQEACTVVGVMPEEFSFYPEAAPMWMLITPESEISRDPEKAAVGVFGRLKPGVSIESAQQELQGLYTNLHRKDKDGIWQTPVVRPLAEQFAYLTGPNLRLSVMVLFGAVTCLLLIACLNIANLLLGRSLARQRELAVRAALGAGRGRLIRQLLTEGLMLSFAGAGLGTLLAIGAVHYFRIANSIEMPPGNPVSVNLAVLEFTVTLAVLTAVVFGLVPALNGSRVDVMEVLKTAGRGGSVTSRVGLLGKVLVAAEVMLSLTLLAGAGLLIESLNRLTATPLGFRTEGVITAPLELPSWSYSQNAERNSFYHEAVERIRVLPGVAAAGFATSLPLNGGRWGGNALAVEGRAEPAGDAAVRDVAKVSITPNYFRVMDVPLRSGRAFDEGDEAASKAVAIVNDALVRKYFPQESPIGKLIKVGEPGDRHEWLSVVGVSADEKDRDFFHEMTWAEIPTLFRPVTQEAPTAGTLLLRAATNRVSFGGTLEKQISDLDIGVAVGEVQTMDKQLSHLLAYPRFRAVVLGTFAGLALVLAGVGVYGVLSQLTAQRTQEFGVRMALGAQKQDLLMLVLRQGVVLTGAGLAAGLTAVLFLTRLLSSLLYGVKGTDPLTMAAVCGLLVSVALLATYLPARRASKVDPTIALRYE